MWIQGPDRPASTNVPTVSYGIYNYKSVLVVVVAKSNIINGINMHAKDAQSVSLLYTQRPI